jgi:glycosyltransferase involved in cell wall biosynthesis
VTISVIVCAHNEERYLGACLISLVAQTRPPDELLVINNASTDRTADVASSIPDVRVINESAKGLVIARERGRRESRGELLVYVDADCRAPSTWLGRTLLRAYDFTLGPATHLLVKYVLRIGVVFYGGNFAVRRDALERIGGFDTSIEFHGEDTNLGRRLSRIGNVDLRYDCYIYTSARRYNTMGKGAVFRLYMRNFVSELLHHRPKDGAHLDVRQ